MLSRMVRNMKLQNKWSNGFGIQIEADSEHIDRPGHWETHMVYRRSFACMQKSWSGSVETSIVNVEMIDATYILAQCCLTCGAQMPVKNPQREVSTSSSFNCAQATRIEHDIRGVLAKSRFRPPD